MPRYVLTLLALVLATGLIAAGCGGDDDDDGGSDDETTTEETSGATGATGEDGEGDSEVAAEVNALCADTPSPSTPEEANEVLDSIREIDGAEDDPAIGTFLEAAQAEVDAFEETEEVDEALSGATSEAADAAGIPECDDEPSS